MKIKVLLFAMAAMSLASFRTLAATNDATSALQKGLFEEEANHDLNAAIRAYQSVVTQFDKDRKLAATAVFRLGECYRKQGNTNDATVQYQRVLSEFADQLPLMTLSRQNLALLGIVPAVSGSTPTTTAAREEQKRLLKEEIRLAQQTLGEQEKAVKAGVVSQESLRGTQRDVLQLKRQLAGLEQAPQEQKRLLEEEIKLAEQTLDMQQQMLQAGNAAQSTIRATQRDILELKLQLASLNTAQPLSQAEAEPTRDVVTSTEAEEVKRIQLLIKDSPDLINAPDPQTRRTPLQQAAENGQLIVAQFLLANGADVNAKDYAGQTALHLAAHAGHKAVTELLLSKNASPQAVDDRGCTPLHLAAERGFRSLAELFLSKGADVNSRSGLRATPLHFAVANDFKAVAELLLARGADPNIDAQRFLTINNAAFLGTGLHVAAKRNNAPLTEMLLSHKANPNAFDNAGQTPLHVAAELGNVAVAKLLVSHGAEVNAKDASNRYPGWTPLCFAVYAGAKEVVAFLLNNNAEVNVRFEVVLNPANDGHSSLSPPWHGYTPLLMATLKDHTDITGLLLESHADPNLQSDNGAFPLKYATTLSGNCNLTEMKLLLDHGADPNARLSNRRTLLMETASSGKTEAVKLLLEHRADPNAQADDGSTALFSAAVATSNGWGDRTEIANLLLAAGADPNQQNNDGLTPLRLFLNSRSGLSPSSQKLAALLREHGALEEVPRLDRIQVGRSSAKYLATVFLKGTNTWNHFTLLELIAIRYGHLWVDPSVQPGVEPVQRSSSSSGLLNFPNFRAVVIRRPSTKDKGHLDVRVDLEAIFKEHACSKDPLLEWGDVVEIPEADHPINAIWQGLPTEALTTLATCLRREVRLTVKGQTTNLVLNTGIDVSTPNRIAFPAGPRPSFMLLPVLLNSGLLRASSDLSRVKVTRRDAPSGQTRELVLDCSNGTAAPALWLREGDAIEVPDKP